MSVSTKTISTLDTNAGGKSPRKREVHYKKVLKSNRKGVAALIGGELYDHLGHDTGDFHIILTTKVNGKVKDLSVETGDVVFQTGTSNRWQAMSLRSFKKRFPEAKI